MIQALSEFAEYVEKQQQLRRPPGQNGAAVTSRNRKPSIVEDHAELDIIDSLGLSDSCHGLRLKELLLDTSTDAEDTLNQLVDNLRGRLIEEHGETLFDLGLEDNGESMGFTKTDWDIAWQRLQRAANILSADCRILMTRNVGGKEEMETNTSKEKDKSATATIMIRKRPDSVEDVIETRIAVVGNGMLWRIPAQSKTGDSHDSNSGRREKYHAGSFGEG